ncbi:MAG TPA: hypothetical protein VM573_05145 [Actinomycetota bacterium]|jgi:hypothetical protein|nr:hypothetical protein [Actinomycetota bacterium]
MTEPRRRRRKRRRGAGEGRPSEPTAAKSQPETTGTRRRRRRRRGGDRSGPQTATLESILAGYRTPRDAPLTRDPDGQDVDEIIRELQSEYGVPLYPQEYRITIKVAEEKNGRAAAVVERQDADPQQVRRGPTGAVREKAPAPPRVGSEDAEEQRSPKRRRRRGRKRRGGGGGGAPSSG